MQIGMVGLGRMGANLVRRLVKDGHQCVVYDVNEDVVKDLHGPGIIGADSLEDLAEKLSGPRIIWLMVPASVTQKSVEELAEHLCAGDIIIDGGNSYYRDDLLRAEMLKSKEIHYIDCGTSGGVFGLERGYCLMIGGEASIVQLLTPIFESIAPGVGSASRTLGRVGPPDPSEQGYLHCGPAGAGHFVKMVHNGIEYGLMAACAEGLNILRNANAGRHAQENDAETTPMPNPEYYQYDFNLPEITEVWRRGSVVASWLLDLTAAALVENAELNGYSGRVSDSGEGRWTALAAIDEGVPIPVISAALFERFASRNGADYANRVLSAMRKQFGGHNET
ncbi:phosphogluconate dehydrogenase (NAD(+)-dependent, decarboxylating) [Acidihalobacter yilgarnensis]|uniref:phosphogluconate dehydrogenase (NAD(+)-dependent, decarboxylating) n=1 Tax=Acidihalobacter yilgarnensis TaxID=2819280 RepID=UPI0009F3D6F0|nr:decarboxylating 6-phosphogluconate dehydrogenase [Acidihalobacter yilgarnensis]